MDLDLAALPDDVDALHRLIRDLAADRLGERTALCEAQAEIERLWLIVQKLQRLQFGRRGERLHGDQLELGLEDLDADIARAEELLPIAPSKEPARDRSDRPSLPNHLLRESSASAARGMAAGPVAPSIKHRHPNDRSPRVWPVLACWRTC